MKETDNNEKNPIMTEEFQITLNSKFLNADELRQTFIECVEEYERFLNSYCSNYLKYFL